MPVEQMTEKSRTPIARFKDGFTLEQSRRFHSQLNLPELLSGGDESVWFCLRASETLPTAIIPPRQPARELPRAENPGIGKIRADTKNFGSLSLDEFMQHPQSYAHAFIVVHRGQIVYENYPAFHPEDHHIWMSVSKTVPSLVIDLLISDGKIDQEQTIGHYVPEFRGTAWENVDGWPSRIARSAVVHQRGVRLPGRM